MPLSVFFLTWFEAMTFLYSNVWRPFGFVTAFLLIGSLQAAEPAHWSQWRGPQRDGQLPAGTLPETLQRTLKPVWAVDNLSPSYSGPVVWGDLVFSTETVNKADERVTAYSLADGKQKWQVTWPSSLSVPFFAASNGDWIRATPAVNGEHLVVSSMRDILVCLAPETGEETWRVDFADQLGTQQPSFGNVCSPLIDGSFIYVQAGQAVTKLSLLDGSVVWQAMKNADGMASSGAFSSPVIADIAGERQLVVQTREALAGVRLEDGKVLWSQPITAFRGMNILTPLVQGDTIFTSAYGGKSEMYRVGKAEDGQFSVELAWANKAQAYMSSPVRIGQHIYLHLRNQRIVCLNAQDGTDTWTSKPFGKYQSFVTDGQQILALDETGELLLIKANPVELEVADRMKVAEDSWAYVAVEGPFVIVRHLKGLSVYRAGE